MRENKRYLATEVGENGSPIPGTTTYIWNSRSMATTCVVLGEKGGEIIFLVEKRGPGCPDEIGKYVFPCGYLGWDETLKKAAVREVYEETGLKIDEDSLHYIGINDKVTENKQNVTVRYYAKVPMTILKEEFLSIDSISRGGEEGECSSIHLVNIDWIREHRDEFAFGHDELAEEVYDMIKKDL